MKAALQEDDAYVVLDPDDAVEVSGEEVTLNKNERSELQMALLADTATEAKKPRRKVVDRHTRKVRAPRFSDAEWQRLEAQLLKVYSPTLNGVGRRKTMNAHEFVREATMHLVKLLEETPKGDKPYDLAFLVPLTPPSTRTRTTEKAARATPVWPGAPLTTADLGLKLDWEPLPKPSGTPPPELLHAQLKEQRSRDMAICPVEKATKTLRHNRRRPPRYDSECCICEWPHALPVDWPVDDAGAELDEKQRARLEAARAEARKKPPICALCDDTSIHPIDETVCPCRTLGAELGFVCAMCEDTGFYRAGGLLHPCNCTTGRNLVAKGHPDTNKSVKLSRKQRAEAQRIAREAVAGTRLDPRPTTPRNKRKKAELTPPPGSSDEFYTPLKVWLPWDAEFHFTLDVCATAESALCPRYFTKEQDALKQSWEGEVWWCNPPYSPGNLAAFIAKCDFEARQPGHHIGVALVPSRTDRKWWHDYVESMLVLQRRDPALLPFSLEVRFRKGRIAFGWPGNTEGRGRNTGEDGSAILIWRRKP